MRVRKWRVGARARGGASSLDWTLSPKDRSPRRTDFDTPSVLASSRCSHTRSPGETLHSGLAEEWAGGFLVRFWKMLIKVVHTDEPACGLDSQNDDVVRRVWKSAQ